MTHDRSLNLRLLVALALLSLLVLTNFLLIARLFAHAKRTGLNDFSSPLAGCSARRSSQLCTSGQITSQVIRTVSASSSDTRRTNTRDVWAWLMTPCSLATGCPRPTIPA